MKFVYAFLFSVMFLSATSQNLDVFESEKEKKWVDSIFSSLTLKEKVAQLMIIRVNTPKSDSELKSTMELIKKLQPSGVTFFAGTSTKQAELSGEIQSLLRIQGIISIDGEWGVAMRLTDVPQFPYQMALGAIQDDSLIYEMGRAIGIQCKNLGIHMNFAPVMDINNNPENPVINYRSFGESAENVFGKGYQYAKGMEDVGVYATIKHFPGHGDTDSDSHYTLPLLPFDIKRLEDLEMQPFKKSIQQGVTGIMVGHLAVPALEPDTLRPISLSSRVVKELLKEKFGYKGLLITDGLGMQGVVKNFGEVLGAIEAFKAGNDLLLLPPKPLETVDKFVDLIGSKELSIDELNERVYRVLRLKYRLGLNLPFQIQENFDEDKLFSPEQVLLKRRLLEESITVLKNDNNVLPIKHLEKANLGLITIGGGVNNSFYEGLSRYFPLTQTVIELNQTEGFPEATDLEQFSHIIIALHDKVGSRPYNTPLYSDAVYRFVDELLASDKAILVSFRNPYTLSPIKGLKNAKAILTTYYDEDLTEDLASQIIFGGIGSKGKLPVSIEGFPLGTGVETEGGIRFKYTIPEEVGISSGVLYHKIDSIMMSSIDSAVFPGGVVFMAKDQKVFYQKSFGYHTYDKSREVESSDIYDLASVTKITGPLPALMVLTDENKFNLDATMGDDFSFLKNSNKEGLTWKAVLAHNARLKPWIPYYTTTKRKNGNYKWRTLSHKESKRFDFQLSDSLFLFRDYQQNIFDQIKKSDLNDKPGFVYSGLSFYMYPDLISRRAGIPYENFVKDSIYLKLGASTLTFNPAKSFSLSRIPPTEDDNFFRNRLLHGVVHDEGAAMMRGVSGNAGLFGNANDLGKLMQMYLNFGYYGGVRYISDSTFKEYTNCHYCSDGNHRGLGFDKPFLTEKERSVASVNASMQSFGHSGYTGTMTWVDPEYQYLFVFLSNRVYPTRTNNKISRFNIRPALHDVFYQLMSK